MKKNCLLLAAILVGVTACGPKWTQSDTGYGYYLVEQKDGPSLGYSPRSGVTLLFDKGYAFKDLNRNGVLDKYEDWRLTPEERAKDLAAQLSVEEIAGLMLYSSHQSIPAGGGYGRGGTYNGKPFAESGAKASDLSDDQKKFLKEDNLRAVLVTSVESTEVAAEWNNNVQAYVEGLGHGIPANNSSDPRNETKADAEFNAGSGGKISQWPTPLGLAATFDPNLVEDFGLISSQEYRALGIATSLSPQIDLATEPRWSRFGGTFGEDPDLAVDLARACVDGYQTTPGTADGWGAESVNTMVKHWPSGGPEEGGRDAHFCYGKYAVYPGNNLKDHLRPFTEGAFKLKGKTSRATAVMPYYTISYNQDPNGGNVGNSYSKYIISDLLRGEYDFEGVVCTDWNITYDNKAVEAFDGKCWGVENLTVAQRHYEVLKAGVDQFGGNNDKIPVLEAFKMWVDEFGEGSARVRFEKSAVRLLLNSFRTGLFENPYLNPALSASIVGCPEFMKAGYDAQLRSVVMVKNAKKTLPQARKTKVYVPKQYHPARTGMFGMGSFAAYWDYAIKRDLVENYFEWCEKPEDADFALVLISEPSSGAGYTKQDGYLPISLQYRPYTASTAREVSVAGGDPKENFTNRTYRGKSVKTNNECDLDLVIETKKQMGDKPVVVCISVTRPIVLAELEPYASSILLTMGVQNQAIMDIVSGAFEPDGLLPMQLPANMETVEAQKEDVPRDMECYRDSEGNVYDFAFGLNWSGVINDERVKKYGTKVLADNCFGIIAGKKATADGSVLFAHNEDDNGEMLLNVYKTNSTKDEAACLWCELAGMEVSDCFLNEYGVAVASNNCPSVEDKEDLTNGGVLYQLRVNIAKRAHSAREGVKILGETVEKYGYRQSGRTYLIADCNEGWMVSVVKGRHWVALRIPDNAVMAIPNNYIIDKVNLSDTLNFLGSKDLIEYARLRGWYSGSDSDFSFRQAYGNRSKMFTEHNLFRHKAALEYFTKENFNENPEGYPVYVTPETKVTLKDMINVLSTHSAKEKDSHNGLICSDWTAYSTIFQLRGGLPAASGDIMWLSAGHPCVEPFIPFYLGMSDTPKGFKRYPAAKKAEANHLSDKENLRASFPDCYSWEVADRHKYINTHWTTAFKDFQNNRDILQQEIFEKQAAFDADIHSLGGRRLSKKLNGFTGSWYR